MITLPQHRLLEHESRSSALPWVLLKPLGWQPGPNSSGRMLWNVVGGEVEPQEMGSTVCAETMIKRGFRVEVTL